MIDVLLCYRSGRKEAIKLQYPLPNPLYLMMHNQKIVFHHFACLITKEEIETVIYLEEAES